MGRGNGNDGRVETWAARNLLLAGVVLPEGYKGDGENLLAAFKGESPERKTPIFWEWRPGGKGDLDRASP